jgi:hypothetical protein
MQANWTDDELRRIDAEDELEIATRRRAGTLRKPVTIWAVRAGDDLFIRSAYGPENGWYRAALATRQARISAGGVERDVAIEDAGDAANDGVDAAYRKKYGGYAKRIVESVTDDQARATTLRLVPAAEA